MKLISNTHLPPSALQVSTDQLNDVPRLDVEGGARGGAWDAAVVGDGEHFG